MYEEFLGADYHDAVRKILIIGVDKVPDSVIDAELNINTMRGFISPFVLKMKEKGKTHYTASEYELLQKAARYYLAAIIAVMLRSKQKTKTNINRWEKKRVKCMEKAARAMYQLMNWQKPGKETG